MEIKLKPIGFVKSTRSEIKDDKWDSEQAHIELSPEFKSDSLMGLDSFSHAEVFFYMDKVKMEKVEYSARHPRNNLDWPKVGVFSQRGKNRPNQIGHTVCKVKSVDGNRLYIQGLDAVDGTPVLDIKP